MKTAFLTTALALAASSSQASLTPSNTTYDLLSAYVRVSLGAASNAVVDQSQLWLSQQFETVLTTAEAALEAEQKDYAYYSDLLSSFYDKAKAREADEYDDLGINVGEAMTHVSSAMQYAPEEWTDVVFDIAEQILPQAKNETFTKWVHDERKAMEERVTDGTSTARLVVAMDVFLNSIYEGNDEISGLFTNKLLEVYNQAGEEYAMEFSTEDDEQEEEDAEGSKEKEETKKQKKTASVKKAKKKATHHGKHHTM